MTFGRRLFLKIGDRVVHPKFPQWGVGLVVEEKTSNLSGGISFVRVSFNDGMERCFMNDLNNYNCCYYAGVRLFEGSPSKTGGYK
jgi:hypothetical protein